ncbi:MAG: acetoacetate decarboxylase family protein [Bdellovibrio sp.]|nr:acetoacetate decarboxylase family protein [Bdellovibrio sp.]
MKTNLEIVPDLLNNKEAFSAEFYQRFQLRHAPAPLQLNATVAKNYLFPTFYGDVTCAIGIFFCSYKRALEVMPHPKMRPISMGRGRSLVVFSNYIYRNVLGVLPYNEIAMTIPIMVDPLLNVPVLPMILPLFKNFGYYCFSMPVTSLENQIRGEKIWGLPKVVQEINIEETNDFCQVEAKENSGQTYYELKIPKNGRATEFDVSANLYSVREREFLKSATHFKGTFNVIKHMALLFKGPQLPEREYLKIHNTPSAQMINHLSIEEHPFQLRYCCKLASCFDLPAIQKI